jgi:DNA-binding response OmpR family regulator
MPRPRRLESERILVVEDDTGTARGLRALLQSRGYQVEVTDDASTAVDRLAEGGYGLVLTDLDLGAVDGTALVLELRASKPDLPLLVVTARDAPVRERVLAELPPGHVLEKPVDPERLLDAVDASMRRRAAVPAMRHSS